MKTLDPALVAHLGARGNLSPHVLVWFSAVLRVDGTPAPWGVWTGDDDRTFTVGAESRSYIGAGSCVPPKELTFESGYVVRLIRAQLAHLHLDVAEKLALTDLRLRRVELHQVHLQPGSHDLVAAPVMKFRGTVETMAIPRMAQGGSGMVDVQMASSARDLTQALPLTKSDATLRIVKPLDRFRKYNAMSGKVTVSWGQ